MRGGNAADPGGDLSQDTKLREPITRVTEKMRKCVSKEHERLLMRTEETPGTLEAPHRIRRGRGTAALMLPPARALSLRLGPWGFWGSGSSLWGAPRAGAG